MSQIHESSIPTCTLNSGPFSEHTHTHTLTDTHTHTHNTGNDLARCLGWGCGITAHQRHSLAAFMLEVLSASPVHMDRWDLAIAPLRHVPACSYTRSKAVAYMPQAYNMQCKLVESQGVSKHVRTHVPAFLKVEGNVLLIAPHHKCTTSRVHSAASEYRE
eukprot:scaffold85335_cov24-Tisochrysis_lutea.AAC.1